MWAKRDLNPRHPACKAGALDQLSYSPLNEIANIRNLLFQTNEYLLN